MDGYRPGRAQSRRFSALCRDCSFELGTAMPRRQKNYRLYFGIAAVAALILGGISPALALDHLLGLGGVSMEPLSTKVCSVIAKIDDEKQLKTLYTQYGENTHKKFQEQEEALHHWESVRASLSADNNNYQTLEEQLDTATAENTHSVDKEIQRVKRINDIQERIHKIDQNINDEKTAYFDYVNKLYSFKSYDGFTQKVLKCINDRIASLNKGNDGPPNDICITGSWKDEPKNGYVYTTTLNFGVRNGACTVLVDHDVATLLSPPQHGTATLRQDKMATGLTGTYLNYRAASGYRGTDNLKVQRKVMNLGHEETYIHNIILDVQ